jgi:uncharacterized ferredoxin-like protein
LEKQAALQVAPLMAAAARTAPKTRGIDNIRIVAMDDEPAKQRLIAKMREIAAKENRPCLARDAGNIENSPALVVLGVEANTAGLNCGFCGHSTCEALDALGGICSFNSIDLGIATASAAEVAGRRHLDNRVKYSVGRANSTSDCSCRRSSRRSAFRSASPARARSSTASHRGTPSPRLYPTSVGSAAPAN